MKGLREKFRKHEGFTLVEMLIVVAIIAILIAVSIPLVSSSLEKARDAVDDANYRDAVALGNIEYLTNPEKFDSEKTYYYVVENNQGSLAEAAKAADVTGTAKPAQGQCSETSAPASGHSQSKSFKNAYIKVTINKDGEVAVTWSAD